MATDKRNPTRTSSQGTGFRPSKSAARRNQDGGEDKTEKLLLEARTHTEAGKYGRAFASLKQILASDPQHEEALRLAATVHLKLGSLVAARTAFDALVRKAVEQEDFESAESLLREYLEAGPRFVPFLEWLGEVLERRGDRGAAATEYAKAVDIILEDQDPEQKPKADELYRKVRELDGSGPDASRLREVFEPDSPQAQSSSRKPTEARAPDPIDASAASSGSTSAPPSAFSPDTAELPSKSWEEQAVPAPFPWEVEDSGAGSPPARPEPLDTSPPVRSVESSTTAPPPPPPTETEEVTPLVEKPSKPEKAKPAEPTPAPMKKRPPHSPPEPKLVSEPEPVASVEEQPMTEEAGQGLPDADVAIANSDQGAVEVPAVEEASLASAAASQSPDLPVDEQETALTFAEPAFEPPPEVPVFEEPIAPDLPPEPLPEPFPDERESAKVAASETPAVKSEEVRFAEPEPPAPSGKIAQLSTDMEFKFVANEPEQPVVEEQAAPSPDESPSWPREDQAPAPVGAPLEFSEESVFGDSRAPQAGKASAEDPEDLMGEEGLTIEEEKPKRKGKRKAQAKSPMWAAPTGMPGSSQTGSGLAFFPTLFRLGRQFTSASKGVGGALRSFLALCVTLAIIGAVLGVLTVIGLSLTWVGVDEDPSTAFHNLTSVPAQAALGPGSNGYNTLLDLGVARSRLPIQLGDRRAIVVDEKGVNWSEDFIEITNLLSGWYAEWDPAAVFQDQRRRVRAWGSAYRFPLSQYRRWLGMPVEDAGFGLLEGHDERYVLALHRLYLAEGFTGSVESGLQRMERDLESWREALAKAKTLRFKLLAAEAMNDNLIIASGLLGRGSLNRELVPTLAKMSRRMNHAERMLRWPMQNQFVLETEMVKSNVKKGGGSNDPFYRRALTYFPLPVQQVLNAHAAYYEALVKHDAVVHAEGDPRRGMPQRAAFTRTPPITLSDYVMNPIDNLLIQEPRVDWSDAMGRVLETEARLRLASLQARSRRRSLVRDPVARILKAGQAYYDPFTGFPMLSNPSKTVLYSVGKDGTDHDGDPAHDLAVQLFLGR